MSRDDFRISTGQAAVVLSAIIVICSAAVTVANLRYAPKGDYATKSDVDSLRWEVRRIASWMGVPSLDHARTGRRP